jgi:hypothetical protein
MTVLPQSRAALRKNDTGAVLCKILPIDEQEIRRELSQVSESHLHALKWSTV